MIHFHKLLTLFLFLGFLVSCSGVHADSTKESMGLSSYAIKGDPGLPPSNMKLEKMRVALVVTESHLRELLEQGFEVAVVSDGTAAARLPEGDGYRAGITNFRYMSNAVWTTEEAVDLINNL